MCWTAEHGSDIVVNYSTSKASYRELENDREMQGGQVRVKAAQPQFLAHAIAVSYHIAFAGMQTYVSDAC